MIRTLLYGAYFIFTGLLTLIHIPKCLQIKRNDKYKSFLYAFKRMSIWGKQLINATGYKAEVIGLENIPKDQAVLFVSNHQSNFDILLLIAHITVPFGFVAKVELKKNPIINIWGPLFRCVFIERDNPRKSILAIEESINNIKGGYSQFIFPEGTRSRKRDMGSFKHGSLKIATKTNSPIVPITVNNTYKLFEENNRIRSANVKFIVHKPIYTKDLDETEKKGLTEYVENIIRSGLE